MAGLVAYSSSDEEDEAIEEVSMNETVATKSPVATAARAKECLSVDDSHPTAGVPIPRPQGAVVPSITDTAASRNVPIGPSLPPPEEFSAPYAYPELEPDDDATPVPPLSPYTATRNLLRDLTLPQVPNLDIPPSPPGSPPLEATKKFEQFLDLKRSKGVHFNERLAGSAAAANPSLPDRLLSFVGLGDARSQYELGISRDLIGWQLADFAPEAFRTALRDGQEKVRKEKEKERASGTRTAIEFAPSMSHEDLRR